ncbi:MAG: electron transport complex subunit RsxG [Alcanivoracaceae bacterium]|nr:electron transport complex subunit RsxG [Alcanivoracaceae bacterium]
MNKFIKLPVILSTITFLTSGLLMLSESATHEKIAEQKKLLLLTSLEQLIPPHLHDNDLTVNTREINEENLLGHRQVQTVYVGTLNDIITVVAIPVTARNGYSGDIDIMVGIKSDGEITSVKILEQHETPGLGDLIVAHKSDWIKQFPEQSFNTVQQKDWKVKRDGGQFDQITGATISPRAVTMAVKKALLYHQHHFTANHNKEKIETKKEKKP